jgi:Na+-transporting NADH:ubiquinone oxidoreductase subunit A
VDRSFSALTVLEENRDRDLLSFLNPGFSLLSTSRSYLSNFFKGLTRRAETNIQGEGRPCIYCSYCEDVCPRGLVPHLYSRQVRYGFAEEALKFGIEACIECGLCSFACPSKLALLEDIKEGKNLIEESGQWSHPTGLKKLEEEGKL